MGRQDALFQEYITRKPGSFLPTEQICNFKLFTLAPIAATRAAIVAAPWAVEQVIDDAGDGLNDRCANLRF